MWVYAIENKVNGKLYVGQTTRTNPFERWEEHQSKSGGPSLIKRAILKHSPANHTFTVIEAVSSADELDGREIYWIHHLGTQAPHGYNLTSGGGAGSMMSEATKAKMSKTRRGRTQSVEWAEKRAAGHRGFRFDHAKKVTLARAHMNGRLVGCSNGKTYQSAYEAALDLGIKTRAHIAGVCTGTRKSCGGYTFKYVHPEIAKEIK